MQISKMFEAFRQVSRVSLNDKFIGDEGSAQLSDFIASHKRIQALELKSNDIGPQGFQMIFKALIENPNLRYLVLEYNNLGLSYEGVQELGTLLSTLNKIQYLNISSNKLEDQSLQTLIIPISLSKSLKLLQLKFNNVSSKSIQQLVSQLKRNHNTTILYIDIIGNKIDKQTNQMLQQYLKQNRKQNPISREKLMTINVRENVITNPGLNKTGMSYQPPTGGFDQVGRENLVKHLENILDQNRRDTAEMKARMERQLEQLQRREKLDARQLNDLDNKCNELVLYNRNLKFELDRTLSQHQQLQRDHSLQMRNHEEKVRQANKELSQLQIKYQDISDRMNKEHSIRMKQISRQWENKLRGIQQRIRMAQIETNEIQNDVKKAIEKKQRLKLDLIDEENRITQRVQDEEAQRYNIKLNSLESKLSEIEEARQMFLKRNNEIIYELEKTEQKNNEQISSLEHQLSELQQKQDLFMKKNKQFVAMNQKLTGDIRMKEISFDKLQTEINSLNQQVELKKKFNKDQVDKVLNQQAYQKSKWNEDKKSQMAKLAELERVLRASQIQNARLRQQYVALAETVQLNVNKAIEGVFTNNNLF